MLENVGGPTSNILQHPHEKGGVIMRDVEFVNEHFYHVYNRGVDKRCIFKDKREYDRFIRYLFEFNSLLRIVNFKRDVLGRASDIAKDRTCLVDIICFCLMPNHFHLILRQILDGGITKFMHKLETGHAMYFNKKNSRTGALFEGRFKAIYIGEDEYLTHLSRYIHLNPVGLIEPDWKEKGVKNWKRANKFLREYKWFSYSDYLGKHNFPSILNKEPLQWYFKTPESYERFVQSWAKKDLEKLEDVILE